MFPPITIPIPKLFVYLVSAAALSFATVRADAPKPLVENGGFEEGATGWGIFIPGESSDKNCRYSPSSENPHTGKGCVKMESDEFARFCVGPKKFPVQPGERYRVSAWIRGNAETKPGTAGFVIRLGLSHGGSDAPGGHLFVGMDGRVSRDAVLASTSKIPTQWTKTEAVVEIPKEADALAPSFFSWYAKGAVFLDDVAVEKVEETTPLSPIVMKTSAVAEKKEGPTTSDDDALKALNFDAPGMEAVKAASQSGSQEALKKAYLEYRRTGCPAKWRVSPAEKPAKAEAQTDAAGDEICAHVIRDRYYRFYPANLQFADMGKDFNWTHNPIAKDDPAYSQEWTWCVISRMQFWENLANAYWKTLDEKYAQEWVAQLWDFAKKNNRFNKLAPGEASLWRTLDASGRVSGSWPYAYYHFINSPAFTPDAQWVYLRVMLDHADLLKKGLEVPGREGNWVAAECYALYTMGVLFPELKEADAWRKFALERLTVEANCTVPADGFESELTPNYHYFSLSSLVGPLKLAKLNQLEVPDIFRTKILAMYQAPVVVMDQSGGVVPTNDSVPYNAAKLAKQGLQLFGDDPLLQWAASGGKQGKALPTSTMLPNAGFYAMRGGWNLNDLYLFFRAGPTGTGHQHEDMLEVVLRAWNKTLLLDPGTYTYDHSEWRRYILNTAAHNTIVVDDKWQHRGANKPPVTEVVKNPWVTTPLFDYVSGQYDGGYQKNVYDGKKQYAPETWVGEIDHSVSHTRRVLTLKPYYVLLIDTLEGKGQHQFDAHFHMDAPSAKLDPATQVITSQSPKDQAQLAIYPLDRTGLSAEIIQGQKEPLLGWFPMEHRAIPTVRFRKTQEAPAQFATFLYPFKGEAPHLEGKPLALDSQLFWSSALKTDREECEVVVAKADAAHKWRLDSSLAGAFKSHSAGMVIRRPLQSSTTLLGAWKLDSFSSKKWAFTLSEPGTVVWSLKEKSVVILNADNTKEVKIKVTQPFAQEVTLAPGVWMEISAAEAKTATAPLDDLKPLENEAAVSPQ